MLIDLQIHSNHSDGFLTPNKIVEFLLKNNVEVASLTDHNTISGIEKFKETGKKMGLKTIPGMELYVRLGNRRFNILWYNFDYKNEELHKLLKETQNRRRRSARIILNKLKDEGYKVDVEQILSKQPYYIAVNKTGKAFYKANKKRIKKELGIKNPREDDILGEYFFDKKRGKLKESYIDIHRVLKLREKIGGQLIFCHPAKHNKYRGNLPEKLAELGIDGIETLSPHHSIGAIGYCQHLARKFDWIETGGSDFHLFFGEKYLIQHSWQWFKVDSKYLRGVKKIIK